MLLRKRLLLSFLLMIFVAGFTRAQEEKDNTQDPKQEVLNVYISANIDDFSTDFIKQEIPVINYVRDLKDAQVFIIMTAQQTGAKGREFTFYLNGQYEFNGMTDTLKYVSMFDDTNEKTNKGLVLTLKMGLMRYIVKTPMAKYVEINFDDELIDVPTIDKWNNWVITLYGGGSLEGEKTARSSNIWGGFNVMKVSPDWKLELYVDMGRTVKNFFFEEGDVVSITQVKITDLLLVKSINEHWSYGVKAFLGSLSYSNYKLKYYAFPGIEYDIFPYSESTRRQVRIMYSLGNIYHAYNDTTIYNKMKEHLWGQRVDISAELVQKWGTLYSSLGWKNYFHDWSKNNLSFRTSLNIRVAKGLQFRLSGGASMIHNQLSLVKGGASYEEVLLRQKELATQFSFYTNFSIHYSFGSIYNSVVNPRFDGLQRW